MRSRRRSGFGVSKGVRIGNRAFSSDLAARLWPTSLFSHHVRGLFPSVGIYALRPIPPVDRIRISGSGSPEVRRAATRSRASLSETSRTSAHTSSDAFSRGLPRWRHAILRYAGSPTGTAPIPVSRRECAVASTSNWRLWVDASSPRSKDSESRNTYHQSHLRDYRMDCHPTKAQEDHCPDWKIGRCQPLCAVPYLARMPRCAGRR